VLINLSPRRTIPFQGTALLLSYKAIDVSVLKQQRFITTNPYFPLIIVNRRLADK